jgi:hypothetical protein
VEGPQVIFRLVVDFPAAFSLFAGVQSAAGTRDFIDQAFGGVAWNPGRAIPPQGPANDH